MTDVNHADESSDSWDIDPEWIEQLREELRAEVKNGGYGVASERRYTPEENREFNAFLMTLPYFGEDDIVDQVMNERRGHVPR
jgi:hypothetical protein